MLGASRQRNNRATQQLPTMLDSLFRAAARKNLSSAPLCSTISIIDDKHRMRLAFVVSIATTPGKHRDGAARCRAGVISRSNKLLRLTIKHRNATKYYIGALRWRDVPSGIRSGAVRDGLLFSSHMASVLLSALATGISAKPFLILDGPKRVPLSPGVREITSRRAAGRHYAPRYFLVEVITCSSNVHQLRAPPMVPRAIHATRRNDVRWRKSENEDEKRWTSDGCTVHTRVPEQFVPFASPRRFVSPRVKGFSRFPRTRRQEDAT